MTLTDLNITEKIKKASFSLFYKKLTSYVKHQINATNQSKPI